MPASKKRQHKPGKVYDFPQVDRLQMKDALREKLSLPELVYLEKLIRQGIEEERQYVLNKAVGGAYAICYRVLRDRFGWGKERIKRHWDACMSYWDDVGEGRLKIEELLKLLETEDGVKIHMNGHYLEEEKEK